MFFLESLSKHIFNGDVPGKDRSLTKLALALSINQFERRGLAQQLIACLKTWLITGLNPTILIILLDEYFFYLFQFHF